MFEAAIEIDPLYVFPRCNLALYLLDDEDVDGAGKMIRPLADATRFHPQEMAFYYYVQASILVQQEEFETARKTLEMALEFVPDYEPVKDLLERLDTVATMRKNYEGFWERQWQRYRAARARLQAKLSTPGPSLTEALPLYTKNALTGMAREVLPWGGWSALRKAELVERIAGALCDTYELGRIVGDLGDDARAALRQVLAGGGTMSWADFDARYGNDLEESPYWQWHTPETTMGCLRERGLIAETTVDGELLVTVPVDLRQVLREILK
jgi:hypothetical protein